MKRLRIAIPLRTAVAVIAAALLATSAMAQPRGNARLSGKVVDEQGQPVADVVVPGPDGRARPTSSPRRPTRRANGGSTAPPTASGKWNWRKPGVGERRRSHRSEGRQGAAAECDAEKGAAAAAADPMAEVNGQLQKAAEIAQAGNIPGRAEDLRGSAREVSADLSARGFYRANVCGRKQRSRWRSNISRSISIRKRTRPNSSS